MTKSGCVSVAERFSDAGCRPDRGKQEGFPLGCRKASHLPVVDRCDAFRALCQEDQMLNPIADPYILGISSGASAGAAWALLMPLPAFGGQYQTTLAQSGHAKHSG